MTTGREYCEYCKEDHGPLYVCDAKPQQGAGQGAADCYGSWVPVTERLPEEGFTVLVYIKKWMATTAKLLNGHWVPFGAEDSARFGDEVTHWMPLPKAP